MPVNFFEMNRYKAALRAYEDNGMPVVRVSVGLGVRRLQGSRTFGERVTCLGGTTKGRTNGMPWDGTSPISAGANPDSHKDKSTREVSAKYRLAARFED